MRLGGKPKARIPGADVAGTVEAVGSDVRRFRRGDEVFGTVHGSFAEYACGNEDRFALKPHPVSFEHAATIPVAGVTALQALRNYGRVKAGQPCSSTAVGRRRHVCRAACDRVRHARHGRVQRSKRRARALARRRASHRLCAGRFHAPVGAL